MPENKGGNRKKNGRKKATKATLILVSANRAKPRQLRISAARKLFLDAYEKTFGNISASCEYAGIHRSTLYRWLNSNSRINKKFKKRFEAVNPKERQKDFIEAKFMQLVAEGVPSAVIYGVKTICRDRGYSDRPEIQPEQNQLEEETAKLRVIIETRAGQEGISYNEMLQIFVENYTHLVKAEVVEKLLKEDGHLINRS